MTVEVSLEIPRYPSGFDLSNYREELLHEREERALLMRRPQISTIGSFGKKSHSWNSANEGSISPEKVVAILKDSNRSELRKLNLLPRCDHSIISVVAKDSAVCQQFPECLNELRDADDIESMILVLNAIAFLYPNSNEENQEGLADDLIPILQEFLTTSNLCIPALLVITVLAKSSTYARDSITCFGIHADIMKMLIDPNVAQNNDIVNLCCSATLAIYSNPGEIEDYIVEESIEMFIQMLTMTKNILIMQTAIDCMTFVTNLKPSFTVLLCEKGVSKFVLQLLDNPETRSNALQLIGNITLSQLFTTKYMIENGLLERLFSLMKCEEYMADVFWIFSNITEICTEAVEPLISYDFVQSTLDLCSNVKCEIKKEAAFFLISCILFFKPEKVRSILNEDLLLLIDEMLSCGITSIIGRCTDAMLRLILLFSKDQTMLPILTCVRDCDMIKDLENLLEIDNPLLNARVSSLIYQLDCLLAEL